MEIQLVESNTFFIMFKLYSYVIFKDWVDYDGFEYQATVMEHRVKQTISVICPMEFSWFPFDVQTCEFGLHLCKYLD